MPEDQPKSAEISPGEKTNTGGNDGTDWGNDWESAFQAEDDAFFFSGKEEDFFLAEPETAAANEGGDTEQHRTQPDGSSEKTERTAATVKLSALILLCKKVASEQFLRLQALPLPIRIPLYVLPLVLAVSLFIILSVFRSPQSEKVAQQPPAHEGQSGTILQREMPGKENATPPSADIIKAGKTRSKWVFPAFFIPVTAQTPGQPVAFVIAEVTLIASVDEQDEPSAEKKIFVRDIIYQFFQNKTIEDLRRFSLARGEMSRELRAWIMKQWPESPVDTVIFNQYRLS